MLKSLTAFSHTFASTKEYSGLVDTVVSTGKCAALFLSDKGVETVEGKVLYWKDSLDSSNYLYSTGALPSSNNSYFMGNAPTYIANDSFFNSKPSIDFADTGGTRLLLSSPVKAKCIVIVYLTRNTSSYIIYAPRTIPGANEGSTIYYDAFPPGGDSTLWSDEPLTNGSVFNGRSRINSRDVEASQVILPNISRCLSVSGISERIDGFGGKTGAVGGTNPKINLDDSLSVQGRIAAIALFDEELTEEELINVETSLGLLYLQYQGIQKIADPPLTFIINQSFSIDLNDYFQDEWFILENFTILNSPVELPLLDITDGLLTGIASYPFEGNLSIEITNSNGSSKVFEVPFRSLEVDALYADIEDIYEPVFIFSADSNKGFYQDRWEDARRLAAPVITFSDPVFAVSNSSFNSGRYIFTDRSSLILNASYAIRTLVLVYRQTIGGIRKFSNQHDDIYGTGNLLTVANVNDVFGNSSKTRWKSYVQTVQVDSARYKLPLYEEVFLAFTNTSDMSINAMPSLKGDVAYIIGFSQELNQQEIRNVIAVLAGRYYASDEPLVFDSSAQFSTNEEVIIDLSKRVVDLKGNYPLVFELLAPVYDAEISGTVLTFTADKDERVELSLEATNSLDISTAFTLFADTVVKDNALYRNLRETGVLFNGVYIPTLDSIEGSTWLEYSGNGEDASLVSTTYIASNAFNGEPVLAFNTAGSAYAEFASPVEGNLFIFAYKRNADASDLAFLLGQDAASDFFSGINGELLHPTLSISPEEIQVNGRSVSKTYRLPSELLSIIILKTSSTYSIDSIAKHKLFDTDSVKGELGLVGIAQHSSDVPYEDIFLAVKNYYLPAQEVINMPLLTNVANEAEGSLSRISGTALFSPSPAGLRLGASRVGVSNERQFAFQLYDFQITFEVSWHTEDPRLNILSLPLLSVYAESGQLVVTDQSSRSLSLALTPGMLTPVSIQRVEGVLSVGSVQREWNVNYIDYLSPLIIGGFTPNREGLGLVRNLVISRL